MSQNNEQVLIKLKATESWLETSEKRIRTLINHFPDALLITDINGVIAAANPRAVLMMSCTYKDLCGVNFRELIESEDIDFHKLTDFQELLVKRFDSSTFPAKVKACSFSGNTDSSSSEMLVFIQDISKEKELERLKSEFTAMLTHDIRTPLASVMSMLQMMEQGVLGNLSERGLKIAKGIQSTCGQIMCLLNDMLDLEKMESGKFILSKEPLFVRETIETAISSVLGIANQKTITIEIVCSDELHFVADRTRLQQVLCNLLGNAIKFSEAGSIIQIGASRADSGTSIFVRDNGRGISEDRLQSIFERYVQVRNSDASLFSGVGLGLAVCKSIVEEHGGRISAESEAGKGSCFWIWLPDSCQQN